MFQYTVHFVQGPLAEKNGGCILIRRSLAGEDVVLYMIRTGEITSVTSENLSKLLQLEGAAARKTISKAAKIRHLMKLTRVKDNLSSDILAGLETKLQEMEKKGKNARRKRRPVRMKRPALPQCTSETHVLRTTLDMA